MGPWSQRQDASMINPPGTDSVYAMYDNQKIYVWYMQDICIYTILSLRYACEMYHTCLICMYVCVIGVVCMVCSISHMKCTGIVNYVFVFVPSIPNVSHDAPKIALAQINIYQSAPKWLLSVW